MSDRYRDSSPTFKQVVERAVQPRAMQPWEPPFAQRQADKSNESLRERNREAEGLRVFEAEGGYCFAVTSGEYSDYQVECVFEHAEDAISYVEMRNGNMLRSSHEKSVESDYTPPNAQYKCVGPVETCPRCGSYYANLLDYGVRVEAFQFWSAGQIPVVTPEEEQ